MTKVSFFVKIIYMDEKDESAYKNKEDKHKDSLIKKESFFSRFKHKLEEDKKEALKEVDEEAKKDSEEAKKELEQKMKSEESEEVEHDKKVASLTKKRIKNALYLIFNILLVVGLLIWNIVDSGTDFNPFPFLDISITAMLLYILLLLVATLVDTLCVHLLIYRKTYRNSFSLSYKAMAIGRHYDNIVPLAGGGQTFMASYLRRRDVPGAISYYIPMTKLIAYQIAWLMIALFSFIFSSKAGRLSYVGALSIIGFIIGIVSVSVMIFVSVFKRFTKKVLAWGCKLLLKMHIIKDYDTFYAKAVKAVGDYQNLMRDLVRTPFMTLIQIILHLIRHIIYYSIPFVIYCIFNGFPASGGFDTYLALFISAALIELSVSWIPISGGLGFNEISFTVLFSSWMGGETFWALLLWRFFNYYNILLQGIAVITYETVRGDRKYLWTKKARELQAESVEFKKECINAFREERKRQRKKEKLTRAK